MKTILAGAALAAVLLVLSPGAALAQNAVPNGDFELTLKLGPWEEYGGTAGTDLIKWDTSGSGKTSWCFKRKPGYSAFGGGNGGLNQMVLLVGGVTYDFHANIAYLATC